MQKAFVQASLKEGHKTGSYEYMDRMRARLAAEMPAGPATCRSVTAFGPGVRHERTALKTNRPQLLAIFPRAAERVAILDLAARHNWDLTVCLGLAPAERALARHKPALVLYDRDTPGLDWREALELLATRAAPSPIVLVSSVADEYLWQEVVHLGGYDVLAKPLDGAAAVHCVNLAWSFSRSGLRVALAHKGRLPGE